MPRQARAGFTLIEMMISLTMLAIVMGGLTTVMVSMQRGYTRQRETARSEDALRNAELTISSILRYAGANSRNMTGAGAPRVDPLQPPFDTLRIVADFNPADADVADLLEDVLVYAVNDTLYVRWQAGAAVAPVAWPVRTPGVSVRFERNRSGHERRRGPRRNARESHPGGPEARPHRPARKEDFVGVHAQSQMKAVLPGALGYRGIALPSAMFALVAVSILAAGVFAFADLSAKATLNQERSTRAMQVADAGISHAVSLLRGQLRMHSFTRILRGSDNFIPTADDSLFINYGLAANDQIPLAGKAFQGHTYFVTVRDDPSDGDANASTDLNGRVLVRCRSLTSDGATAEVVRDRGSRTAAGICGRRKCRVCRFTGHSWSLWRCPRQWKHQLDRWWSGHRHPGKRNWNRDRQLAPARWEQRSQGAQRSADRHSRSEPRGLLRRRRRFPSACRRCGTERGGCGYRSPSGLGVQRRYADLDGYRRCWRSGCRDLLRHRECLRTGSRRYLPLFPGRCPSSPRARSESKAPRTWWPTTLTASWRSPAEISTWPVTPPPERSATRDCCTPGLSATRRVTSSPWARSSAPITPSRPVPPSGPRYTIFPVTSQSGSTARATSSISVGCSTGIPESAPNSRRSLLEGAPLTNPGRFLFPLPSTSFNFREDSNPDPSASPVRHDWHPPAWQVASG